MLRAGAFALDPNVLIIPPGSGNVLVLPSQIFPTSCVGAGCCQAGWQEPLFVPMSELNPAFVTQPGGACCLYTLGYDPGTESVSWHSAGESGECTTACLGTDLCPACCQTMDCYWRNLLAGLDGCTGLPANTTVDCRVIAWTIGACNALGSLPVPQVCSVPCWLSCAPPAVQAAWCALGAATLLECPAAVIGCLGDFAAAAFLEDPAPLVACLASIATGCLGAAIQESANTVANWLGLNPLGCPGCSVVPPGPSPCPPNQYPQPCKRGDFIDQRSGCCDPPLTGAAAPDEPAPFLLPTPLRLPIPTDSIAVTACGCHKSSELEDEVYEE